MADITKKFKFKLLTGSDPQAQYAAIGTYDPLTFYLLGNGIGYLGEVPLFGGGAQNTVVMTSGTLTSPEAGKLYVLKDVIYDTQTLTGLYFYNGVALESYSDDLIATYLNSILVTDMTGAEYTGDNTTVASTKAIIDLIKNRLSDSNIVNAAFFRKVESHTITDEDLLNEAIQKPIGTKVGDIGLLFTADTDGVDGGESYYFISLVNYLTSTYTVASTNTIALTMSPSNEITADLKVKATEKSIVIDTIDGGISLNKTTAINDEAASVDKLVTEAALVNYIQNSVLTAVTEAINEALADVVTYNIDDGTSPSV